MKPSEIGSSYVSPRDMLKVPFFQKWKSGEELTGNRPDKGTTLYLCRLWFCVCFGFESAGIQIFGRNPYITDRYLWIKHDSNNYCLDMTETPIMIAPLVSWKVAANTSCTFESVEVYGFAIKEFDP